MPESKNINLTFNDVEIAIKNAMKNLAVTFNNLWKFNKHTKQIRGKS